jgi:hypothetical protein
LPFSSLRGIVPWYDAIPQIGAVLFAIGWWSGPRDRGPSTSGTVLSTPAAPTRLGGLMVALLAVSLVVANRPRVEAQWSDTVPIERPEETVRTQRVWFANELISYMALERAEWQRRHLGRLDQAEVVARQLGAGREAIHRAFGRLDAPDLPPVYDAVDLLDLPLSGGETDLERIRARLAPYFVMEPDPPLPPLPSKRQRGGRP